jgi:hypothetical protein
MLNRVAGTNVPDTQRTQIRGAIHVLPIMNPRIYNGAVLAFLTKYMGQEGGACRTG